MDITLPLDKMSATEKLRLLEKIWESFEENEINSPEWHKNVLAQREQMLKEGKEEFLDWEEVKRELRQNLL